MAARVKISKDGSSINFTASDSLPTSTKKFRQSPEIEGFYRFLHENGLQREAFEVLTAIIARRKAEKGAQKAATKSAAKEASAQPVKAATPAKATTTKPATEKAKPAVKVAAKATPVRKASKAPTKIKPAKRKKK